MKRTDPKSVGELLGDFFQQRNLLSINIEGSAMELWREIVGPYVLEATEGVYIRSGVIYVTLSVASARADISMRRNWIVQEINARLGRKAIRAIVLR